MRYALIAPLVLAAFIAAPAAAEDLAGRYRLAEGPDIAGQLELTGDHRFGYALAAGALDERAQGRWEQQGDQACLTTEPAPKPPQFETAEPISGDGSTIRVTWPSGRGIPGVNFSLGFDSGEPISGYTQEDGWTMPAGETRLPRWIELTEPIHRIKLARTPLNGRFRAVLVPNDLGVVDFRNACFEVAKDGPDGEYVLHRTLPDGSVADMKFRKVER